LVGGGFRSGTGSGSGRGKKKSVLIFRKEVYKVLRNLGKNFCRKTQPKETSCCNYARQGTAWGGGGFLLKEKGNNGEPNPFTDLREKKGGGVLRRREGVFLLRKNRRGWMQGFRGFFPPREAGKTIGEKKKLS